MNELVQIEQTQRPNRIQVVDAVPVLDTGRFEQMARLAKLMASSNLIPESLCCVTEGDRQKRWLPTETVTANCFLIINQAVGWGMDPFAVAQCASVIAGRLCYEGKLIAAAIDQKLGIQLRYKWNDKTGDALGVVVSAEVDGRVLTDAEGNPLIVSGTVGEWKTTRKGSPWFTQPRMQLAYRGAREWTRLHRPSIILGVYSNDEMEAAVDRQERLGARQGPPAPPPPPQVSFVQPVAHQAETAASPETSKGKLEEGTPPAAQPRAQVPLSAPPPPPPPPQQKATNAPPPSPPLMRAQPEASSVTQAPISYDDIPGPTEDDKKDFARLRNWVEAACWMAETGESLEKVWNTHIEPLNLEGLDYEDCLSIYRRRERELEP